MLLPNIACIFNFALLRSQLRSGRYCGIITTPKPNSIDTDSVDGCQHQPSHCCCHGDSEVRANRYNEHLEFAEVIASDCCPGPWAKVVNFFDEGRTFTVVHNARGPATPNTHAHLLDCSFVPKVGQQPFTVQNHKLRTPRTTTPPLTCSYWSSGTVPSSCLGAFDTLEKCLDP